MTARCSGITRSGSRCQRSSEGPNGLCWAHDPTNADQRRRLASKAGKSKPDRELQDIKTRLSELAEQVLAGEVERGNAAVAGQLYNTVVRTVAVELKVREQLDLEGRLEQLEEALEQQGDRHRGHA